MQFSEEKENFSYGSFLEQSNSSMAQSTSSDNHSSCASIVKRKVSRLIFHYKFVHYNLFETLQCFYKYELIYHKEFLYYFSSSFIVRYFYYINLNPLIIFRSIK